MNERTNGRGFIYIFTRNDPHASNPLPASDTILQHARGGGLDAAPVRVDAGDGDYACGVGVEEEGDACGACFQFTHVCHSSVYIDLRYL